MKRFFTLLAVILLGVTSLFAQKLSFQAVVRNSANELVPNATLTVAVSVLDASNNVQYSENHTGVQTNQNGLLSLMVGDGTPTSGTTMADVVWSGSSIQTVITLPGGATITNTTPVNAVPYALSAGNVDPTVVADAITDYLAHHSIGGEDNVQADWDETDPTSDAYVQHKPTDVSAFNNDAGYITKDSIPANVSVFNNDAQYVSNSTCDTIDFCSLISLVNQLQTQIKQQDRLIDSLNSAHTDGIPCPGSPTVTDYDGNIYNSVKIGNQCWMKENLRTTHYADGTEIPVRPSSSSTLTTIGYHCYPNSDIANVNSYGLQYNWVAVMSGASSSNSIPSNVQGVCPSGWHVPSDAEWIMLINYVSFQDLYACSTDIGHITKALSSNTGWPTCSSTSCAPCLEQSLNNATGFSALPAGESGSSASFGTTVSFWSSTTKSSTAAWHYLWTSGSSVVGKDDASFSTFCSVRCLRD